MKKLLTTILIAISILTASNMVFAQENTAPDKAQTQLKKEKEPNFYPFMKDVKTKIKRNWIINKSEFENKYTTTLIFTVDKQGKLSGLKIAKASGNELYDKSAKEAVQLSAPFKHLPKDYKQNSVDIEFTFDYNQIQCPSSYHQTYVDSPYSTLFGVIGLMVKAIAIRI